MTSLKANDFSESEKLYRGNSLQGKIMWGDKNCGEEKCLMEKIIGNVSIYDEKTLWSVKSL